MPVPSVEIQATSHACSPGRASIDPDQPAGVSRERGHLAAVKSSRICRILPVPRPSDRFSTEKLIRLAVFPIRLPPLRERKDDIVPLATSFIRRFSGELKKRIDGLDPDAQRLLMRYNWPGNIRELENVIERAVLLAEPPENEAQLEYWARVSQAYFLYYDAVKRQWDERGEVYVRYGPPDSVQYNPINVSLYGSSNRITSGSRFLFPINVLLWSYKALGMDVTLHDRMLSERYELPMSMEQDMDPVPNADSLARRDMVATRDDVLAAIGATHTCTVNALRPEQHTGTGGVYYGRRGHIKGSINLAAVATVDDDNVYRSAEELRRMFAEPLSKPTVITYCGGGIAASAVDTATEVSSKRVLLVS